MTLWKKIEIAKRRLMYSVLRLNLPRPLPDSAHPEPLVFVFLADDPGRLETVHVRHLDVEDGEVGLQLAGELDGEAPRAVRALEQPRVRRRRAGETRDDSAERLGEQCRLRQ